MRKRRHDVGDLRSLVVRCRTESKHDDVIGERAVGGADDVRLDDDGSDLGAEEAKSRRRGDGAQGVRDGVRWQLAGRHLVKERCEKGKVVPIHQRDVGLPAPQARLQVTNEVEASEAPADDDDALRQASPRTRASTRASSRR